MQNVLEVERDEEEHREERHADQQAHDVRSSERSQPEDREWQQRVALAALDHDERREQSDGAGES